MKQRCAFIWVLLCVLSISIQAADQISIGGKWLFKYAANQYIADSLAASHFYNPDFRSIGFDQIKVPSCWPVLGYEEPAYRELSDSVTSEGFYIRHFLLPQNFKGKRVLLHFGGVWASAEVWLNGKRLGRHDSGFTSFSYLVSSQLHEGDNVLAVRVRQNYPGYKTDTYDDWLLPGIYRDVTLEAMPDKRWIDKVTAVTDFDADYHDATLKLKLMVADNHKNTLPGNYRSDGTPYQLHVVLADADGKTVADQMMDCNGHPANYREYAKDIQVKLPHQWTAETPYLYTLTVELMEQNKVVQVEKKKIGFREISTKDGIFRINGQNVKLRGVNRHDEWPTVGRATTHEQWLTDLKLMKQGNINYVRACHYQHAQGFIDLCDSIGMYVGEEISLGGAGYLMFDPSFSPSVMLRTQETVERDLNHPSIIYWSVGNEDPFTELHLEAVKTVKGLDGTRPCLLPWNASTTLPADIDVLAPHYWTSYEYDSLAKVSNRPIITTEYVHAYGNNRFGGLEDCWDVFRKNPAIAGGAVWMWADQGLHTPTKKDMKKYRSIERDSVYLRIGAEGWDGITDSYRHPLADYMELKAVYAPVSPSVKSMPLAPTVNLPIRNEYDFISSKNMRMKWEVYLDNQLMNQGTNYLDIAPHSTGYLKIDTKLNQVDNDKVPYLRVTIMNPDGTQMTCKSVILTTPKQLAFNPAIKKKIQFELNPATGMPANLRPTVWHQLTDGDCAVKNAKGCNGEKFTYQVKQMSKKEFADSVVYRSEVRCIVNETAYFDGDYSFIIYNDGTLRVNYAISPHFPTSYVPLIGMAIKAQPALCLGWGPDENYPNKKAAAILGVYDAAKWTGTHGALWLNTTDGRHLILGDGGFIDRDKLTSTELRIVHHVLGRTEKGRLNDRNYQLLNNETYQGSFLIK